jgi:hypothetical protein
VGAGTINLEFTTNRLLLHSVRNLDESRDKYWHQPARVPLKKEMLLTAVNNSG